MGTLIILAVVVWGVFMGIVLFSLLSMAKMTDQIYDRMLRGEERATPSNPVNRPASDGLSPTSSGEARVRIDLSGSVAAR